MRDEAANLAWAVEQRVESVDRPAGRPRRARRRAGSPARATDDRWHFVLSTAVPENWVPLVPVRIGGETGAIAFQRGRVGRARARAARAGASSSRSVRLLIHEEEIPREGARVVRRFQSARGPDGRLHVWVGRRKGPGRGEGSSTPGVRHDRSRRIVGRSRNPKGEGPMSGPRAFVALAAFVSPPSWPLRPGPAATPATACGRPSPTRTSTSSWPTASRTGSPANDHGGLPPGTNEGQSGFDPTGKGWYHGGDLKGLLERLDYIKGLGTTAIWLTPSFKNKAVQDNNGFPSSGYHGYWITDFTQIDPHLGTNDDLRALVDAAHPLGMKVYFDVITNHTADVIRYQEGAGAGLRLQGPVAVPHRRRDGLRRPRLRRRQHLPRARADGQPPVPGSRRARRSAPAASPTTRACRTARRRSTPSTSGTSRSPPGSTT